MISSRLVVLHDTKMRAANSIIREASKRTVDLDGAVRCSLRTPASISTKMVRLVPSFAQVALSKGKFLVDSTPPRMVAILY